MDPIRVRHNLAGPLNKRRLFLPWRGWIFFQRGEVLVEHQVIQHRCSWSSTKSLITISSPWSWPSASRWATSSTFRIPPGGGGFSPSRLKKVEMPSDLPPVGRGGFRSDPFEAGPRGWYLSISICPTARLDGHFLHRGLCLA